MTSSVGTATATIPRIALAHDWLVGMRGGERVLDAIVRLCHDRYQINALYTMFHDRRRTHTPDIDTLPVVVSSIGSLAGTNRLRRWLLPLYPAAVSHLSGELERAHRREPVDLLVSTSSAAIKGLRPPPGVPHICYCHTPARYLWSQAEQYTRGGARAWARGLGLRLMGRSLREWDRSSAASVTTFIANSTHTMREIARVYARPAEVVHPPVRTDFFEKPAHGTPRAGWLYVGALEPYKRVDLAIRAAAMTGELLTIVGRGSELPRLRHLAGPRVTFEPDATDERVRTLYGRAALLVFPQVEDFGIVAVEAQACGTPVVAFGAGGALDTVLDRKTGVFFDEPTPRALADAAATCTALGDVSDACRANAAQFGESHFQREMLRIIERTLAGA